MSTQKKFQYYVNGNQVVAYAFANILKGLLQQRAYGYHGTAYNDGWFLETVLALSTEGGPITYEGVSVEIKSVDSE